MSAVTEIFFARVRDHCREDIIAVSPDTSLREVVGRMAGEKSGAAIIVDAERRPIGLLTEQDVVRRATFAANPEQPVRDLMSAPVRVVGRGERLFIAIARMRRFGHRHMPVVHRDGPVCGILDLQDAMASASGETLERIDALTGEDDVDALREIKAAQIEVAEGLFADNLTCHEVLTVISYVNNDIYARLLEHHLGAMANERGGAPTTPFALVIMGSGGRLENFLTPDQDYGFVIADGAVSEDEDRRFVTLADRLSRDLDRVGIPLCKGNVMATNELWRDTLSGWKAKIDQWARDPRPETLLDVDICFDFRPGWGERPLAMELRAHATEAARGNMAFLRSLQRADAEHGTALRWLGRIATKDGKVDLKAYGLLPLVEGARLLALREGIAATGTLDRLAGARDAGTLDTDLHDDLAAGFETLGRIVLRAQFAAFAAGEPVSSRVEPRKLARRDRRALRDALKAIETLRSRQRFEFTGAPF